VSVDFASPWLLLLLIAPPVLAVLPWLARRWHRPATMQYSDLRLAAKLSRSLRQQARFVLPGLRLLALALLIIALARPRAGFSREVISGAGVDISIVLDISGSMASLDFEPNRLVAAKQVIREFIQRRQYDRIGLVVFASEAFSQVPPTLDYNVLLTVLEDTEVSWDIGLDSGTAIGLGLSHGANMLRESEADSRVMVLLTDGANNSGQIDPLTAAKIAEALDIRVYTIGVAKPGLVPLPLPNGRIEYRDTEIDEETLQQIAQITNGLFFRAEDRQGLQEIYDIINDLERSQVEVRIFTRYSELAVWLLGPAVLLLVLEILLRHTWLRSIP
jgi:Ca-activated chloride channel homolog